MRARQAGQGGGVGGRHLQHAGGGRGREEDQAAARPRARQDGVLHPHGGKGRIQGALSYHLICVFDYFVKLISVALMSYYFLFLMYVHFLSICLKVKSYGI